MNLGDPGASLIALKCLVNGLLNAAIAALLVAFLPWNRWAGAPAKSPRTTLPAVLLNLTVVAVLLPTLVLLLNAGHRSWTEAEDDAIQFHTQDARRLIGALKSWESNQRQAVDLLAREVARVDKPEDLQAATNTLLRAFPALDCLGVADARGAFLSQQTDRDARGHSGLRQGMPGFPAQGSTAQARLLWNARGLGADMEPLLILTSPTSREGKPVGSAVAAVRLDELPQVLLRQIPGPSRWATLLDAQSRVIASTDPGRLPRSTYDWTENGTLEPRGSGLYWRWPARSPSGLQYWGGSSILYVQDLAPRLPVTLVLETSLDTIQRRLHLAYIQSLITSLGLSLLAVALVWLVAAWAVGPVRVLAAATSELPEHLGTGENPAVPDSPIVEFEILSQNFAQMARELRDRFGALTRQNLELERINRALLEETRQRQAMEQRMRQAQRLEALGLFAGGVAHDFNNLLAAILGYADLAASGLPPEHPSREGLQLIHESSLRARNLIHQILSFSKPSRRSGHALLLQEALPESLTILRSALPAAIEFQVEIDGDVGPVEFDRDDLSRVLVNLASNAENAMRDRERRILSLRLDQVWLDEARVEHLDLEAAGNYACLEVADTGCGIPEQDLPHLFEPFFTTRAQGTGLGLPLIRDIVRGHRGGLEVQSTVGQGTSVRIYLPLSPPQSGLAPAAPAAGQLQEESPRGCERVLFVDDEAPLARLGRLALGQRGYQVESFTLPEQALERFRQDPTAWDLLVTDQTMPGMNGTRLVHEMRELRADLPAILCTGFGREGCQEEAEVLGLAEVLVKPLTLPELTTAVRRVLDQHQAAGSASPKPPPDEASDQ